jgi:hypothetical protein
MWPLSLFLFFAMSAAPQQNAPAPDGGYIGKVPQALNLQPDHLRSRTLLPDDSNSNLCFTIRSYHFRRQDGQAPVPAGVTTCTPAKTLRQRRVSPTPRMLYVPLGMQQESPDSPERR